jgi:hypothetical protein
MNSIQKRFFLFIIGCIGVRTLLVYLSKNYRYLNKYISIFTLIAGIGFLVIYFKGYRKKGLETGGDKIWWNDLRPVHGIIYLLFTYYVWFGEYEVWRLLALDVIIGLISFLHYHIINGNISKLFS